jgi:uncharacterized protein YutE (UPF0331/DUF86 family)
VKYNGVIQRKLALLDDQVQRLMNHTRGISFEQFEGDWLLRSACERALQVAAEVLIDIAERIIALENAGPVIGAAEAMDRLVDIGVIPSSEPYRSIVRFRNLIVHEYEAIDPRILYDIVTTRLDDFRRFRGEVDRADGEVAGA